MDWPTLGFCIRGLEQGWAEYLGTKSFETKRSCRSCARLMGNQLKFNCFFFCNGCEYGAKARHLTDRVEAGFAHFGSIECGKQRRGRDFIAQAPDADGAVS